MNWLFESEGSLDNGHSAIRSLSAEERRRFDDVVDELAEAMASGQPVNLEETIANEPALEVPLRLVFDSLSMLQGVDASLATREEPRQLGNFHILEEIGRGGMGVVYEAEQISLRRRVALKILPYAAFLSPSRLQRFRLEAQAAAILRHPNIVHVHCVGTERGVHYYAMELIEGRSLAEVIGAARTVRGSDADTVPVAELSTADSQGPQEYHRQVANIGIQIARALAYAHQQGIVHRDIKPSNLILDEQGKPWVTDFGLAQTQDDGSLTATGDTLGTLRYMSPEQAAGTALLDHRTDIYSLAATLYELTTLKPVVEGESRQLMLRQLEEGRIASPRKVSSAIPRDFERVLLKALSHQAEDRYASAANFADDLQRFVDDKPVVAQPTSKTTQAVRWMRRHKLVTFLVASLLLLATTVATAGTLFAVRFRSLAEQTRQANSGLEERNQRLVKLLSKSMVTTTQAIENLPESESLKPETCIDLIASYEELLAEEPTNRQLQYDAAIAYSEMAWGIHFRFSRVELGREWILKAKNLAEGLVAADPKNPDYHNQLAWTLYLVGREWNIDDVASSEKALRHANMAHELDPSNPRFAANFGFALGNLSRSLHEAGDSKRGDELFDECVRVFEEVIAEGFDDAGTRLAYAWQLQSAAQRDTYENREYALAHPKLLRALDLYQPDYSDSYYLARMRLAHITVLTMLGQEHTRRNELSVGEAYFRNAINLSATLRFAYQKAQWARQVDASSQLALISNLIKQRRIDESIEAADFLTNNWGQFETHHKWLNHGDAKYLLGALLWHAGERRRARLLFDEIDRKKTHPRRSLRSLVSHPIVGFRDYSQALVEVNSSKFRDEFIGATLYYLGNYADAKRELDRIISESDPPRPADQLTLAMVQQRLGNIDAAKATYQTGCANARDTFDLLVGRLSVEASALLGVPNLLPEMAPAIDQSIETPVDPE